MAPWLVTLGICVVAVPAAVAAAELPLLRAGPLPDDLLTGSEEYWRQRLLAAAAAVGAGWGTALLTQIPRLRRRTGLYGQVAAALFAALLMTALPEPLRRLGEPLGWPGCLAVAGGMALLAPLLRERGMASLVWPPLLLGLLLVHGRQQSRQAASRAAPLTQVQAAVDVAGPMPFLSVPRHLALDERRALALGLRRPFFDRDVGLLMVDRDSPEERRLGELGGTGLRIEGRELTVLRGASESQGVSMLQVHVSVGPSGVWGVAVLPPGGAYDISIVTATGVVRFRQDAGPTPSGLGEDGQLTLRGLLAPPLPEGLPVMVLAEAVGNPEARGWAQLRSP